MVFGAGSAKDSIEHSKTVDLTARVFKDMPPIPPDAARMLAEAQATLDDRSVAFHRRMKFALTKSDEAVEAFPDVPQVRLFRGNLRFQNLDHHIARLDFERLRELLPDNEIAILFQVRILMEIGNFRSPGELVDEILRANPEDNRALAVKAEWYEKQGMASETADILITLLPEIPSREGADLRVTIGRLLLEADNPQGAVDILEPLIDRSTQNSEAHRVYGDALSELDRNEHALDAYKTALHHNPGNMKAHFNMGMLLREMGFPSRAKPELEIVATTDLNDPDAHFQLFELAREKGNDESALGYALQYVLKADEAGDDDPAVVFLDEFDGEFSMENVLMYGQYLIESGEPERAVKLLEPFAANEEIAPPFEVLMSQAYRDLDATDKALEWTEKALDHYVEDYEGFIASEHPVAPDKAEGGEFAELVCQKAELLLTKGEFDTALETLEELGEDDSMIHLVFRIKGEAAFLQDNYEEALEHFHNALEEHPADVDTLASLGATYRKMGDTDFAINYYLRAHLNDAEDTPSLRALVELNHEAGRAEDAQLFLGKYIEIEDEQDGKAWAQNKLAELG